MICVVPLTNTELGDSLHYFVFLKTKPLALYFLAMLLKSKGVD